MAELITTTPTATTVDVSSDPITAAIETSIADLPGAGDDDAAVDDGPTAAAGSADGETPPAAPATQESVPHPDQPDGGEPEIRGRLSAKRHQEILTRQREKQAAEHAQALKAHQDRLAALAWAESPEGQVQFLLAKLEEHPEAIAQALAAHPKYADLIQLKAAAAAEATADEAVTPGPTTDGELGEMPAPNRLSPDGQYSFYDAEGLAHLVEWASAKSAARAARETEARIRAEYDGVLKPIVTERVANQKYQETYTRVKGQLDHARQAWPLFAEHEAEIRPLVTGKTPVSLLEGYLTVVVPKLQAKAQTSYDEVYKQVLADMNSKATASGDRVDAPAASGSSSGSMDPVEAAIRRSIARIRTAA